jgi:hypothetical protein
MIMTKRSAVTIAISVGMLATVLGAMSGSTGAAPAGRMSQATVPGAPFTQASASPTQPTFAQASASPTQLTFAGYQWTVKSSTSPVGPGPNLFDAAGPFVDSSGALHLQIVKTAAGWESSEVILNPTLGYGTYRWTVDGPLSTLDPNAVLALFTYDNSDTSPSNREIDFEASRFAIAGDPTNAQYVVQPWDAAGNLQRITLPNSDVTTVVMTWIPGRVTFSADSLPLWTNSSSSVPTSATEQVHMSLWLFQGVPPSNGMPLSVKVTDFEFTPRSVPTVTSISPTSGPTSGGTAITITGTGFTGATSVSFGGYPGKNVVVVSPTTITVTSPAYAAGLHYLQVTTPEGTSGKVAAAGFTYEAAPSVTSVSPKTGPTSGGTKVTITGTGFTGATSVSFGGYPGKNLVVVSPTTITVTSPAYAAGLHYLQVTTPEGTSGKVAAAGFTYE